jgi:hypothetical protein
MAEYNECVTQKLYEAKKKSDEFLAKAVEPAACARA